LFADEQPIACKTFCYRGVTVKMATLVAPGRSSSALITELRISHLRSFGHETVIRLRAGLNVIVGANGSGKSNALDAVLFALLQEPAMLHVRSWAELTNRARVGPCAVRLTFALPSAEPRLVLMAHVKEDASRAFKLNGGTTTAAQAREALLELGIDTSVPSVRVRQHSASRPIDDDALTRLLLQASGAALWQAAAAHSRAQLVKERETLSCVQKDIGAIEALLERYNPDILVMQNGTNLLSLFSDGSTVIPSRHDTQLRSHLAPFLKCVTSPSYSLKKIYWVAPPVCERISSQSQDVLVESIKAQTPEGLRVIDSRLLIKFPYRNLQPDRQHFFGADMTIWADSVFALIEQDLSESPLPATPAARIQATPEPPLLATTTKIPAPLVLRARLERKIQPYTLAEIAPYHESLVGFVYRVLDVHEGQCESKFLLVLRPAHIDGAAVPLDKFQPYKSAVLRLIPIEETRWATLKTKEPPGTEELDRYLCEEDHIALSNAL
jgi:hypothetical protein